MHKSVCRRPQAGAADSKETQLQLNIKPGRLLQSFSSSFGPPACSPGTAPLCIQPQGMVTSGAQTTHCNQACSQNTSDLFHVALDRSRRLSPLFASCSNPKRFELTFPEICSNSARNCFSSSVSCGPGVGCRGCNTNHTGLCKNCKT